MPGKTVVALDIETAAGTGFESYEDAALDQHRNRITLIAQWGMGISSVSGPEKAVLNPEHSFLCHNGKFDFKTLITKGVAGASVDRYEHDTQMMAASLSYRIPQSWLDDYNAKRKLINKALGKGVHRTGSQFSLKCLAPYFLGVEPFWEVADHDNEEYALKDVEYTYRLWQLFTDELKKEDSYDFYYQKFMPWNRMLLEAELGGIGIDNVLMKEKWAIAEAAKSEAEAKLREVWADHFKAYKTQQEEELTAESQLAKAKRIASLKPEVLKTNPEEGMRRTAAKIQATAARYDASLAKKISEVEGLNLNSHVQLTWLLRDRLGLDITEFNDDEESTGKAVLQRLAGQGRKDVEVFLDYRREAKLCSAFFPSYQDMQWDEKIFCSFNGTGARTGRLSSAGPNLQQVPGHLHPLFINKGGRIINYDLANIEPMLIAYLTEDYQLCDLMLRGESFHDFNVKLIFGYDKVDKVLHKKERDACKEFGLSVLYGAYAYRIQESMAKRGFDFSIKQCKGFHKQMTEAFEGVFEYKEAIDEQLLSGERLKNIFGRPVVVNPEKIKMTGFNTCIQGSASDLLLESGRRIAADFKEQRLNAAVKLFVHDEIVAASSSEDAVAANAVMLKHLTGWELPTKWGVIKTKAEGGINDCWAK